MKNLVILFVLFSFIACVDNDTTQPELKITSSDLVFVSSASPVNLGNEYLFIESNGDWTISGTNDWCSTEKSAGTGNAKIKVTVTNNNGFSERFVILTVTQQSLSKTIKVTQSATPYQLDIDRESITYESDGDHLLVDGIRINGFEITSNSDWTITGTNDWCSVSKISGSGRALIEVIAKENKTGADRNVKLTITAGNVSKTLTINQKGVSVDVFDAITDVNFRNYCKVFDTNKNGVLSITEVKEVEAIYASNRSISSLAGIEYFTEISSLECKNNKIEELVLTKNTRLVSVLANFNPTKKVDVTQCKDLLHLWVGDAGVKLDLLDVSNNSKLFNLYCSNSQLSELNISKNTELAYLDCSNNKLISIDVSNNPKLSRLHCTDLGLSKLDITKNPKLQFLRCSNNKLNTLDISKNIILVSLTCSSNLLTSLDISKNTKLTNLDCKGNINLSTISVWSAFDERFVHIEKDDFTVLKQP